MRSLKIARQGFADQTVDAGEKCRESFARSGGRGDERGAACQNVRPALLLGLGGRAEALNEPLADKRMGPIERGNGEG